MAPQIISSTDYNRAAMKRGYNSHYVIVNAEGVVPGTDVTSRKKETESDSDSNGTAQKLENLLYDEIVIPQESQITPVYIVRFDTKKISSLARNNQWKKEGRNSRKYRVKERKK